ncbi:MAG TPA: hypothetical protein VFZ34_06125, partial [Blastocatellia bacterium]|nr:hypothetical protein [Blastocatellia bacterium]
QVVTTKMPESSIHCHNSEAPPPPKDSHNCQTHDLTFLLAASDAKSLVTAQPDWQPVAVLPTRIEWVFSSQPMERVRLSALRSPPRLPQRLNLRI